MIIPEALLKDYGSFYKKYVKEEYIFHEDDHPEFYYQVIVGSVKLSSYSDSGQEFIQGIFKAGESFGEPPVFGDFPYPNNAIALEESVIARLPISVFFELLKKNHDIQQKFNYILSHRLRYKAMIMKEIASYNPEHILMSLLKYIKSNDKLAIELDHIPYTRQQIADMTGLRVETVIRTIKKLSIEGRLEIKRHKIFIN